MNRKNQTTILFTICALVFIILTSIPPTKDLAEGSPLEFDQVTAGGDGFTGDFVVPDSSNLLDSEKQKPAHVDPQPIEIQVYLHRQSPTRY